QRKILNRSKLEGLIPLCYFDYSQEQLDEFEAQCNFPQRVLQCREMQGELQIYITEDQTCSAQQYHSEQQQKISKNSKKYKISFYTIVGIVIGCFSFGLLFLYVTMNNIYFNRIKLHFYHFLRYGSFRSKHCTAQIRRCSNSYMQLNDNMNELDATENDLVYRPQPKEQRPMKVVV
ncbi:unnamed protein product, partial [Didymodactylos carnosus]